MDGQSLISQHQAELTSFYAPYFDTDEELTAFVSDAFDYENGCLTKRQMLYQVQRFVTLANDIDKLRPGRDCLRMLFIKICLESLCSLSGYTQKQKTLFYDVFIDCFSQEGTEYILDNFALLSFGDEFCGHVFEASHELNLGDFFELIKVSRDMVVHQGIYWEMQFFAHDDDSTWLASIETKERILKSYTYQSKEKQSVTYHFETTLNYERFVYFFIEACVSYIKQIESTIRENSASIYE